MKSATYKNVHTQLNASLPSAQKGAVLILALVMLTVLTIIGASSMSRSSLELKVASNAQQHNVAFQAAQSRLAFATSNDPLNPINFLIPINFSDDPSTWPVQTCDTSDGCPGSADWAATATVVALDCDKGIGDSLEEGKGVKRRYFAATAVGETTPFTSRSTQVRAIRYPVKNC
jgi:hypothetical protein